MAMSRGRLALRGLRQSMKILVPNMLIRVSGICARTLATVGDHLEWQVMATAGANDA
jgi:hypothetical protein